MSPFAALRRGIFLALVLCFFSSLFLACSLSLSSSILAFWVSLGSLLVALDFRHLVVDLIGVAGHFASALFVFYSWCFVCRLWLASAPLLWSIMHQTIVPMMIGALIATNGNAHVADNSLGCVFFSFNGDGGSITSTVRSWLLAFFSSSWRSFCLEGIVASGEAPEPSSLNRARVRRSICTWFSFSFRRRPAFAIFFSWCSACIPSVPARH
jgi:hypothetical protein